MKIVKRAILGLIGLTVILGGGVYWFFKAAVPCYDVEIVQEEPQHPVTV